MEAVRAFNNELSSLYDTKPPVSKAKMAALTKSAMKAIKFYKHVVQSVEKFIQKCRPEYKVPGLYVIDSIVRQSRHQFGIDKDVFAPRFMKNICVTFQNLFKCPPDQKSKIVRVLNLWQKNSVMPSEVIQPMMDVAADPSNTTALAAVQQAVNQALGETVNKMTPVKHQKPEAVLTSESSGADWLPPAEVDEQNDVLKTVTKLLEQSQAPVANDNEAHDTTGTSLSAQQQQLQQLQFLQQQLVQQTHMLQHPQAQSAAQPIIDSNLLSQIQTLTNQLLSKTQEDSKPPEPTFNKKLLDFDYGESDDEEDRKEENRNDSSITGTVQNLLNDPNIMQQIQQMSATIQKNEELKSELTLHEERQKMLQQQQEEFDKQIQLQQPPPPTSAAMHHHHHHHHMPHPPALPLGAMPPIPMDMSIPPPQSNMPPSEAMMHQHHQYQQQMPGMGMEEENSHQQRMDEEVQSSEREERDRYRDKDRDRHRKRSRSRSPGRRRKRSRSRSRDRKRRSRSRDRHRRSRSHDREKDRDKDKERERQREKERERKKKGLPPVKDGYLSICTKTLWIGHLNKQTTEDDLRREVESYGEVELMTMVIPRGCAFVCMTNRKDAAKALDRLKGAKLLGNALKVAWATNKGITESKHKDKWEVDVGVTYLPWDKIPADYEDLAEGGLIDEETLPEHMKQAMQKSSSEASEQNQGDPMEMVHTPGMLPSVMPQFEPPVSGMISMMPPPPLGVMPPPMMLAGQMPPNIPPPGGRLPLPGGPVVAGMMGAGPMVGGPLGLPRGVPPVPITGIPLPGPLSQGNMNGDRVPKLDGDLPLVSLPSSGSQLAMAIQNIVSNSSSITAAVSQSTPGVMRPGMMGARPGVPPPNFNPQMPPPNFRMPPPGFDPRRPPPPGQSQMGEQGPGVLGALSSPRPMIRVPNMVRTPGDKPSLSQMIENWPKKYAPPNENGDMEDDMDLDDKRNSQSPGHQMGGPRDPADSPINARALEGFGLRGAMNTGPQPQTPQMGGPGGNNAPGLGMLENGPRVMGPLGMMQQRFPGMGNRPERPGLPGNLRFQGPGGANDSPRMRMRSPGGFQAGVRMGGHGNFPPPPRGNGPPQGFMQGFRGPNPNMNNMNVRLGMERPRAPNMDQQWGMDQKWGPDGIKPDQGPEAPAGGRNFPDREQPDFNRKDNFGFDGGNRAGESDDRWGGGGGGSGGRRGDRWGGGNRGQDRERRDFDRREDRRDNDRRDRFGNDDDMGRDRRDRYGDRDRFGDRHGRSSRDRGDRDREDRGRDRRSGPNEDRDDYGRGRRNGREHDRDSWRSNRWSSGGDNDKADDSAEHSKDATKPVQDSVVKPLMETVIEPVKPLMDLNTVPSKPIAFEGESSSSEIKSLMNPGEDTPQNTDSSAAISEDKSAAPSFEPDTSESPCPEPVVTQPSQVNEPPAAINQSETTQEETVAPSIPTVAPFVEKPSSVEVTHTTAPDTVVTTTDNNEDDQKEEGEIDS